MKLKRISAFDIVNTIIMLSVCVVTLYPLWYVTINSFLTYEDSMRGSAMLWPHSFTFDNFRTIFEDNIIPHAFMITVLRTLYATIGHVLFTAMVAYPLSKSYLIGKKTYMRIGLITMLFGGGMIPYFILIYNIGLYDTFWVYIIPGLFSYYNMLIMRTFFMGMPASIEESAKVDGAGDLRIFLTIVLPNAKAVLATISLYCIVYHWNDHFSGYIYVRDNSLKPLQTILYRIISENLGGQMQQQAFNNFNKKISPNSIKYASMLVAIVPILAVYPLLQKYLVKGAMIGAVKG